MSDEPVVQPEPTPPTSIETNLALAADQQGEGSEIVECPTCGAPRRKFLIDAEGKCDSDRTKDEQARSPAVQLGWPEVRQRRNLFLFDTDSTQVEDYPAAKKAALRPLRQQLRDVTLEETPFAAWTKLDLLARDISIAR